MSEKLFIGVNAPSGEHLPTGISLSQSPKMPDDSDRRHPRNSKPNILERRQANSLNDLQLAFFSQMHGYLEGWPSLISLTNVMRGAIINQYFERFGGTFEENKMKDGDWYFVEVPEHDKAKAVRSYKRTTRKCDSVEDFNDMLLLGMVSQFDAFIGHLLRLSFEQKPELIANSERKFTAKSILEYSTIEAFQEAAIDKEVEAFLRQSHEDQFSQLESMLGTKLTKDLENWPKFIETFERRNLLAHSRGLVSEQYLLKCQRLGIKNLPDKGDALDVTMRYLSERIEIFAEIGVKVSQVVSRRLNREDSNIEENDSILNEISYACIEHGHWRLAKHLLQFGINCPKHPNDRTLKMMVVNLANAYRLLGHTDKCDQTLDAYPWHSYSIDFQISVAAVRKDVARVVELMAKFDPVTQAPDEALRTWPIFTHVRDDEQFHKQFEKTFGKDFKPAFALTAWNKDTPTTASSNRPTE